jgi:hypothetical protein
MLQPPLFSLNSEAHGYLTYIQCVPAASEAHKQNAEPSNVTPIFHQNTRDLRNESDELIHSFEIDAINAHILLLSEHHMVEQDLLHLSINGYQLGFSFCRTGLQRGGVCIYVKNGQHFIKIDTLCYCKEQELEICAIQLENANLIILSLSRALLGDS